MEAKLPNSFFIFIFMTDQKNIQQHLPHHRDAYLKETNWLVRETEHYHFHYFSGSVAEREIARIASRQERAFARIVSRLSLEPPREKISYYLYPDAQKKRVLMGDEGEAQAIYHDRSIHIIYNDSLRPLGEHEDTHILTLQWGVSIGLFQEGLAEYLSEGRMWSGKPRSHWLKEAAVLELPDRLHDLMSHQGWLDTPDAQAPMWYAIAASWTEYLIKRFGLPTFQKLYTAMDRSASAEHNSAVFEKETGVSFRDAERDWRRVV